MASWFSRRRDRGPSSGSDGDAYVEGRRDERRRDDAEGADARPSRRELGDAYQRGRREERLRRRSHPVGMFLLSLLAIVGLAAIVAPFHYGSFTAAGSAADSVVAATTSRATAPVRGAANKAGDVLQNAGGALKSKAG